VRVDGRTVSWQRPREEKVGGIETDTEKGRGVDSKDRASEHVL